MEYHFSTREKNGGICLILSYKVNRKWRQKSRQGFKTKKEARAAQDDLLDAARKDAESGASPELAGITLRDFTEKIFLRDKKNSIEYGTAVLYRQSIARVPSIADKPLHDITEGEVINAYNMLAGKLEISTRNQTLAKVKTIFSYAVRTYHIRLDNPVLAVAIDKDKREKKIKAFTKEEADQLVESIENPTLRLAVLISLNTGMRFAEVAGLTWADIDFFKRTITVNKQWGTRKDGSKGFKPPKSRNGYRTLHLTARLAAALQDWKQSSPRSIDGRILPDSSGKSTP